VMGARDIAAGRLLSGKLDFATSESALWFLFEGVCCVSAI
jgi:hypothetical protein